MLYPLLYASTHSTYPSPCQRVTQKPLHAHVHKVPIASHCMANGLKHVALPNLIKLPDILACGPYLLAACFSILCALLC